MGRHSTKSKERDILSKTCERQGDTEAERSGSPEIRDSHRYGSDAPTSDTAGDLTFVRTALCPTQLWIPAGTVGTPGSEASEEEREGGIHMDGRS